MRLILHTDGGSRGNPGPAAAGVVLTDADTGQPVHEAGYFLGRTTNNVAEYQGLLRGLDAARDLGAAELVIRSDSQLMVRQLDGQYKVKSADLKPLFEQAKAKLRHFPRATIDHVYRHKNADADRLANLAMDAKRDVLLIDRGKRVAPAPGAAHPKPDLSAGEGPDRCPPLPCFTATLAGKPRQCLAGQAPGNDYAFGPTTPEGFCLHAAAAVLSDAPDAPLQWPSSRRTGQVRCRACHAPINLQRLA